MNSESMIPAPMPGRHFLPLVVVALLCVLLPACGGGGGGGADDEDGIALSSLAFQIGGERDQHARAVATLSDGSFVLGGRLMRSTTFGAGEPNETTLTPSGSNDAFLARFDINGRLLWVRSFGGPELTVEHVSFLSVLADDSIVAVGHILGEVVFGDGEPNETTVDVQDGAVFVARFDAQGRFEWVNTATSGAFDIERGLALLPDGSCVIAGRTQVDITIGGIALESEGTDGWIARFDGDGNAVWALLIGTIGDQEVDSIAATPNGRVRVAGTRDRTMTFGADGPNETLLEGEGAFLATYDLNGLLLNAFDVADVEGINIEALGVLPNGATVLAGTLFEAATFGPGTPNAELVTPPTIADIVVARFSSAGTLQWLREAVGSGSDGVDALTMLADSSIVVGGDFMDDLLIEGGNRDDILLSGDGGVEALLFRYTANGSLLWARSTTGGSGNGTGVRSVDQGPFGTIMVAGVFEDAINIGSAPGPVFSFTAVDDDDLFVARIQADGSTEVLTPE